ncbi:GntR family transcriptional regulator [Marinivivus vitaminiproducens]|uniref:GntR family transcriptional regulator n=1 Tax=Marinivivus vitaminiproducens TaxID=3035935 RepID=UPI00279CC64B|nr:GntR family transcriptional regulator [Geminicoccaceae bacterium SCSIO 64248]
MIQRAAATKPAPRDAASRRTSVRARNHYLLANQILDHIRASRFRKNQHLVESALAERFDVSRTLVRTALRLLDEQRIVQLKRHQGYFLRWDWEQLEGRLVDIPPSTDDEVYRIILRDRLEGAIPERVTQVALIDRYDVDRSVLLRVLSRMANEGLLIKNKGHGWTFQPTIDSAISLRNSYDLRRVLEPAGILLPGFAVDREALGLMRSAHLAIGANTDTVSDTGLFTIDADFHEMIAGFTGNSFFLQAIQQQNRLRRAMEYNTYTNRTRVRDWLDEHLAIIDALAADRRSDAARLMTVHLDNGFGEGEHALPPLATQNG